MSLVRSEGGVESAADGRAVALKRLESRLSGDWSLLGVCERAPSVLRAVVHCLDFASAIQVMCCCKALRAVCHGHACLSDFGYRLPNAQMHEHYVALETRAKHNLFGRYRNASRLTLTLPLAATRSKKRAIITADQSPTDDKPLATSKSLPTESDSTKSRAKTHTDYALFSDDSKKMHAPLAAPSTAAAIESNVQCASIVSHMSENMRHVTELRLVCDSTVICPAVAEWLSRRICPLLRTVKHLVILVRLSDRLFAAESLRSGCTDVLAASVRRSAATLALIQTWQQQSEHCLRKPQNTRLSVNFPLSDAFYTQMAKGSIGTVARLGVATPTHGEALDVALYSSAFSPLTSDKSSITRNTALILRPKRTDKKLAVYLPPTDLSLIDAKSHISSDSKAKKSRKFKHTSKKAMGKSLLDSSSLQSSATVPHLKLVSDSTHSKSQSASPPLLLRAASDQTDDGLMRVESSVRLQLSLFECFLPQMTSLHVHGSKSLMNAVATGELEWGSQAAAAATHHVLFGLKELCIHVSAANVSFVSRNILHVPQLRRLQLVVSKKSAKGALTAILAHFEGNYGRHSLSTAALTGVGADTLSTLLWAPPKNCAKQLRYLNVVSKGSGDEQNLTVVAAMGRFLRTLTPEMTLLRTKLVLKFSAFSLPKLVSCVDLMLESDYVFKRDTMTFVIVMPLSKRSKGKKKKAKQRVADALSALSAADDGYVRMKEGSGGEMRAVAGKLAEEKALLGLKLLMESRHLGTVKIKGDKVLLVKARRLTEQSLVSASAESASNDIVDDHCDAVCDRSLVEDSLVQSSETVHIKDEFTMTSSATLSHKPTTDESKWQHSCYYCKVLKC